jgi:contractile injection system tube protein
MERVSFVVESTGERLGCLLNPESLQVTRNAGVRRRRTTTGLLAGAGISDDPLLYAGGGQTDLVLDLLFDIGIAGSTIQTTDVRDLTRPLWDLAESTAASAGAAPPVVRFLWGKSWNIPGVVTAVAERLEQFTPDGAPTRSWLRMRFVRVNESAAAEASMPQPATPPISPGAGPEEVVHQVVGGGSDAPGSGERLEDIAFLYYGDPSIWRLIAEANDIVDPSSVAPGTVLRIPASAEAGGGL